MAGRSSKWDGLWDWSLEGMLSNGTPAVHGAGWIAHRLDGTREISETLGMSGMCTEVTKNLFPRTPVF